MKPLPASLRHEAVLLFIDIHEVQDSSEQAGCLLHFIIIPLTLLLGNTCSWASVRGSVFLASNDLRSVLYASQFHVCVCVSHGDWLCVRTFKELPQKEIFEQQSSVRGGSISHAAIGRKT